MQIPRSHARALVLESILIAKLSPPPHTSYPSRPGAQEDFQISRTHQNQQKNKTRIQFQKKRENAVLVTNSHNFKMEKSWNLENDDYQTCVVDAQKRRCANQIQRAKIAITVPAIAL